MKAIQYGCGLLLAAAITQFQASAQDLGSKTHTVGLMKNSDLAFDGYTFMAPLAHKNAYLLDNCGHKLHTWYSNYTPGASTQLLSGGRILRTNFVNNPIFNLGGAGGRIEILDWNSKTEWYYEYSTDKHCQHHDALMMPNGNILFIAWESKTLAQAKALGWINDATALWPDHVIEVKPTTPGNGDIVWEWHLWDHLVQDADSTKPNYGVVSSHPELIDINFLSTRADWNHLNAIDYNEDLDQIILSCHAFSEIWIIDHSTTTAQAASHTGGRYGKGGDLLYRWGNNLAFKNGTFQQKQLFLQHHPHWIPKGLKDEGKILFFNNGTDRIGPLFSTVEMIEPPVSSPGVYTMQNGVFGPASATLVYENPDSMRFFSPFISGAQRLPNGNTFICEGMKGNLFEVDNRDSIVWRYVNPTSQTGIFNQGDTATGNLVFRAEKYSRWDGRFVGLNIEQSDSVIELNPDTFNCALFGNAGYSNKPESTIRVFPQPAGSIINIQNLPLNCSKMVLCDLTGRTLLNQTISDTNIQLDVQKLSSGLYIINLYNQNNGLISSLKVWR